jgi:hypothetical protein
MASLSHLPKDCIAFSEFQAILHDIRTHYSHLNPNKGAGSRLIEEKYGPSTPRGNQAIQEYIKGGFITIMASWEAFTHDVMEEALLLLDGSGEGKLSVLKKQWPHCRTLIQGAFKDKTEDTKKPAEVIAFKCMEEVDSWRSLLEHKCKEFLSKMQPYFCEDGGPGIGTTFIDLFSPREATSRDGQFFLSKAMASHAHDRVTYEHFYKPSSQQDSSPQQPDGDSKVEVSLAGDPATLRAILRLYYGVRCVLVHGKSDKTFKAGGALYNFDADELNVPNEAKEQLKKLFTRVKSDGSGAQIDYYTLVNARNFLKEMAWLMVLAINECFSNEFKVDLWSKYREV